MSGTIDSWIGTSGSWSAPDNWLGGLPLAGSLASFGGSTAETITFATTAAIDGLSGDDAAATLDMTTGTLTVASGGNWNGRWLQTGGVLALSADTLTFSGAYTQQTAATTEVTGGATLNLTGGGTLDGHASGAGTLLLQGGVDYTIGSSAALGAGTVDILNNGGTVTLAASPVVAGGFTLNGGVLALGTHTLVLEGPTYLSGEIVGAGEVAAEAPTSVGYLTVASGATLLVTGTLLETGNLQLGAGTADSATLHITSTATYDFAADVGITAPGTASVINVGVLEKTGSTGNSYIAADLTNSGKIVISQGTIGLEGAADTIGGTVSGAGTLNVLAGTVDLATNALTVAGLGIYDGGTTVNLNASPVFAGSFVLDGATLNIASGHTLTLRGGDYLRGLIDGPGGVTVTGSADLAFLELSGGATLTDAHLMTEDQPVNLGASTADSAHLAITAAGTFDLLDDVNINASGTATISNAGLFEKTGTGLTSVVFADLTSTGKLEAAAGNTLALEGASNTLSGYLLGAGEIDLRGGGQFSVAGGTVLNVSTLGIFDNGTVVRMSGTATYAGTFLLGGGTLDYAAAGALTLSGSADLDATVLGPVTVTTRAAQTGGLVLSGGAELIDALRATQTGNVTLGTSTADAATLKVNAGASYTLASNGTIYADGTAELNNAGLLEKTASDGTSAVFASVNNSGELLVTGGNTLALEGATNLVGGSLEGGGEIDLRGGGQFSLAAGVVLVLGTLGIYDNGTNVTLDASASYAGAFSLGGGATLDLSGVKLTLDRASLDGTVHGGAVLVDLSAETGGLVLTGGATLDDASLAVLDNSNVTLGTGTADAATLLVGAQGLYDIRTDNYIYANGTAVIDNTGEFEKTGFTGTSVIYADIDSTGTLAVNEGTLSLQGASNTLAGQVIGVGELDLRNASTSTLAAGVTLSVGTLDIYDSGTQVILAGSLVYKGLFTLGGSTGLTLNGNTFTDDGSALLQGGVGGTGDFVVAASADAQYLVITDGATLEVTGTLTQDHYITLGTGTADHATIAIAVGATYDLISDDSVNANGTATISNAGTLEKTGTDGTSTIDAAVVNTGQVDATIGTIDFQGTLTNDGTITAANAAVVVAGALGQDAGKQGVFDIGANGLVAVSGATAAAQTFAFTSTSGTLRISDPAAFAGAITGFTSGDTIDLAGIAANGLSYANGVLKVTETTNGTLDATYTLDAPGIANSGSLALVYDNNGGTAIVLNHVGPDFTNPGGTITADTWTLDANANWSAGGWYRVVQLVPLETVDVPANAGNDAEFDLNGTVDATITYNETDTVNRLDADGYATLDMTGGRLTINAGGAWSGGFDITAGTLDAVTGWSVYGPTNLGAGATGEVDAGTFAVGGRLLGDNTSLEIENAPTLAGTVVGQGEFLLLGGYNFTIDPGFTITSSVFDLAVNGDGFGSYTTLDTNLGYAGIFALNDYSGNSANLFLSGHTLTLSGTAYLNGYVSGTGSLALTGTAEVGGLTVNNSATVTDSGTVVQDGALTTGSGTTPDATVVDITKTGTWNFVNNSSIAGYGATTIDNAGLIEKTGGTGGSNISGSVFIDTGKITVAVGALDIGAGSNTIEGAISGAGGLYFDGGPSFVIGTGAAITTAVFDLGVNGDGFGSNTTLDTALSYAGQFILTDYSGNSANLFLNGETLTLKGTSTLNGYISGAGVVDITNLADISGQTINNSATVNVTGKVTQDGGMTIGDGNSPDTTTISVATTGKYDFLNDSSINLYGSSVFDNAGLLEKTGGVGTSGLFGGTFTNTGTLMVATGAFYLGGTGNLGGTVSGAGTLGLYVGTTTLDAGATVSVANLALLLNGDGFGATLVLDETFTYGGSFESYDYSGNATYLNLNGFNATFTGASFWNGQVNGTGTLGLAGTATIAGQGVSDAVVEVTKTTNSIGNLGLSDGAVLQIAAVGVFDMLDDGNAETSGAVTNAGLIEKTAGTGVSYIQGDLNSTGSITAATGTIDFQYAASSTVGGTVSGAGTVFFVGGGNYTLDAGTVLSVATLGLYGDFTFGGSLSYAGNLDFGGGTLALNGHTLISSGNSTLDGFVAGPGTLSIAQSRTAYSNGLTLSGTAVLNDAGTLVDDGGLVFGTSSADATTLSIATTGVLNLNSDSYSGFQGAPVLRNAGLIEKTGVTSTASLDASVTSTGTILVSQGTLLIQTPGSSSIGGTVEGVGGLTLQGGSTTLAPGVSLTIAAFSLVGGATNVLNLSLTYAGAYTLNNATENVHGDTLTLTGVADLANGTITGPGLLQVSGTTSLGYISVDGGATLDNTGGLAQTGDLTLGDAGGTGSAVNAAGGTWNLIADGSSVASSSSIEGTFDNLGLLEKTSGTGTSFILNNFTNAAGATIDVAAGTIFVGSATNILAGTVEGAGALVVQGFATISSLSVTGGSPDFVGGASVSGTIVDTGATLFTGGTLSGTGTLDLASGGVASLGGTVTSGITVDFTDKTDMLALSNPAGFAGRILGMAAGDTIDLLNTPASSITGVTYASNTLTVDLTGGSTYALHLPGSFTQSSFHIAADGHNGAAITV